MTCLYIAVDHETYKGAEQQMRAFAETTHKTEPGFYHKSIRIKCGDDFVFEIHGPLVKAGEEGGEAAVMPDKLSLNELNKRRMELIQQTNDVSHEIHKRYALAAS